jgi:hypothetical protein
MKRQKHARDMTAAERRAAFAKDKSKPTFAFLTQ